MGLKGIVSKRRNSDPSPSKASRSNPDAPFQSSKPPELAASARILSADERQRGFAASDRLDHRQRGLTIPPGLRGWKEQRLRAS
jgi:hypothetical protein